MKRKGLVCAVAVIAAATVSACAGEGSGDSGLVEGPPPAGKQWLVVGERGGGYLTAFDADTLERWGPIARCDGPTEVLATPDGSTAWASCSDGNEVVVLDVDTLSVRHRVRVGVRPVHTFLSPDRRTLWVGDDGSGDVSAIDLETGAEERVLTGNGHHKMALVPDGSGGLREVWVSNIGDATLSVIDAASKTVITNVSVGPAPHGMDYAATTDRVYNCSGDDEGSVEVLDTTGAHANTVVSRIPLPDRCGYLHVHDGEIFATVRSMDLLARIDPATEEVDLFDTGDYPDKFVIDGEVALVSQVLEAVVTAIDLESGDTLASVPVGAAHVEDGGGHRGIRAFERWAYVPNEADGTVSVIDMDALEVVGTLDGLDEPSDVAVAGPRGGTTYPR